MAAYRIYFGSRVASAQAVTGTVTETQELQTQGVLGTVANPGDVVALPEWGSRHYYRERKKVAEAEPQQVIAAWIVTEQEPQREQIVAVYLQTVRGKAMGEGAAARAVAKGSVSYEARNERELLDLLYLNAA